ncbi:MAG: C1 family peptidase [Magnetococcales bacterium]|nr:C1 family peptidase [Magnetococcales bacterium]
MGFKLPELDARPDRLDLRDRMYCPPVRSLIPRWPSEEMIEQGLENYINANLILDQGQEGACTGFGLACVVNYLLWYRWYLTRGNDSKNPYPFPSVSPRMLYHLARFYDEWPGEDYEGSSCRGALKAWHKHGVCFESTWPYRVRGKVKFVSPKKGWDIEAAQRPLGVYYRIDRQSVVDMQAAIQETGAIYVSAKVHKGWKLSSTREPFSHDSLPSISFPEEINGGHAFALVGYNERGFIVQNSWGTRWGMGGFAILTYDDWVENGSDAWVCGLGVPQKEAISPKHVDVSNMSYHDLIRPEETSFVRRRTSTTAKEDPTAPWTEASAYRHTVVMENEGRAVTRLVEFENAEAYIDDVAHIQPKKWFDDKFPDSKTPLNLVIHALGGLNSEKTSIKRIRHLAPCFVANGVYPLFLTWNTGAMESIRFILEDTVNRITEEGRQQLSFRELVEKIGEAKDRMIEVGVGKTIAKPIWTEIKQNAQACIQDKNGGYLLLQALNKLKEHHADRLHIHIVGHSAGSIILGHLLKARIDGIAPLEVTTCSLFAPACTVEFANTHYSGILAKTHIHLLSDEREKEDGLPTPEKPIYGKSLLYLVSRSLEKWEKTPILGLHNVFCKKPDKSLWNPKAIEDVKQWQDHWKGHEGQLFVVKDREISTGVRNTKATHGCFDNDVGTITQTLEWILKGELIQPVTNLDY